MARYKIAICDDEIYVIDVIEKYLREYYRNACLIYTFSSGEDLLASMVQFDIAFLDIEIGKLNGIQVATELKAVNNQIFIIFVTNYTEYWRRAFHIHAFEYLEKPILKEAVLHVLDEIELYRKNDVQDCAVRLKSKDGIIQIKLNEIVYFEYYLRKVKMVLETKEYMLTYALGEIEKLVSSCDFARPHRAYIVNLRKIERITGCDILLSNGAVIPLAQKKAADFKRKFEIYLYSFEKR